MHFLKTFLVEGILYACHLINRMPLSILHNKILFSCLYSDRPTFSVVHCVFGSTCFVKNIQFGLNKLEPRVIKCVFVGCSCTQTGHKCFDHAHRKFYISVDVTFFKSVSHAIKCAFAPIASPMHQHMPSSKNLEKEIVHKSL